jgi:hypothetical protein
LHLAWTSINEHPNHAELRINLRQEIGSQCETFTLRPGDVLVAEDHTGSGHKWRLIDDEPWKRAYVIFKEGANTQFVSDRALP